MQAVGLGIERYPIMRLDLLDQVRQLFGARYHAGDFPFFVIPSGVEESLNISER